MLQRWIGERKKPGKRRFVLMTAILVMTVVCSALVRVKIDAGVSKRSLASKKLRDGKNEVDGSGLDSEKPGIGTDEMVLTAAKIAEIKAAEASIEPGQYPIMGVSSIRTEQMAAYFKEKDEAYPEKVLGEGGAPDIETFCKIYYEEAVKEGVRPEVAFAQTMKETGWLQYGGDARIEQYNFAGLGTTGGGVPGNSFPDVRTGVRAQIQHLKAYATADNLAGECVDDRYTYVAKGCAPYVEWLGQKENPEGRGWAVGKNYGYDIVEMIHAMQDRN